MQRRLRLVKMDSTTEVDQEHLLRARAAQAGYRLERRASSSSETASWHLLDADDGERIYSSPHLDRIEGWLDS